MFFPRGRIEQEDNFSIMVFNPSVSGWGTDMKPNLN